MTENVWGRRELLQWAALGAAPWRALAQESAGLITREAEPKNLESPFPALDSFLTPNDKFYVRDHFAAPVIEASSHSIRIEGDVSKPYSLSFDELRKMPQKKVTATLECAGNSRAYLVPKTGGVQWELGAVSNAEWMGVPLAAVLERAGVHPGALEVVLEGVDRGEPRNEPRPPGGTPFARSLPLAKARRPEVLLALSMNGKELPALHGFPVRAVVPGFYGMASVKWLHRIQVIRDRFNGYWQTVDYAYWDRSLGVPMRRPLLDMMVKSLIARPSTGETVKASGTYRVQGAAWSGDADVTRVDLSSDGGRNWAAARIIDPVLRYAWRRWEFEWKVPAGPGTIQLLSRATDSKGNVQPMEHNKDTGNYAIHHVLPVAVVIG